MAKLLFKNYIKLKTVKQRRPQLLSLHVISSEIWDCEGKSLVETKSF